MFDDLMQFLEDVVLWFPRVIYEYIAEAIELFLDMLPDESYSIQGALSGVTSDLAYFLSMMEFGFGLTAVTTALLARFFLRRIPIIGQS